MTLSRSLGVLCLLVIASTAGCAGSAVQKITFPHPDSEGSWTFAGCGYEKRKPECSSGSLIISSSAEVTGGDLFNFGVDKRTFTGGKLDISDTGRVNGTISSYLRDTDMVEEHVLLDGQMTFDANMIVYAGKAPITNRGIGILVKESGSFSPSDLKGTWIFPLERGIFTISVGGAGDIRECSFTDIAGNAGACEGTVSVSQDGSVSGKIHSLTAREFTIQFKGQMNPNKGSVIFAGPISRRFEGAATLAIKQGGNFSSSAMQGNWRVFHATRQSVLHGEITVDESGTVIQGKWNEVEGGSGTFTLGSLSVNGKGRISGFLTTSTDRTFTVYDGQLSSVGDIATVLDTDKSGVPGHMIFVSTHD